MKSRSNIKTTSKGGIVPILKKIRDFGIAQTIRATLGGRVKQAKYEFADIFIPWTLTMLCGGKRLDHISKRKKDLGVIPGLKWPSHDTLGRVMKKVATEIRTERSITKGKKPREIFTDYNDNIPMNRMLVRSTKRIGILKEGISYSMDIDATFLDTIRRGALRKKDDNGNIDTAKIGFNPMICAIKGMPVYVSMRDGYANARFKFLECLQNSLMLLEESKIKIARLTSDAAGYNKEALDMLDGKGIKFNIRFPYHKKYIAFNEALQQCDTWRETEIETANFFWKCEIADIPYKMWEDPNCPQYGKTWRVVTMKRPTLETLEKINPEEYERVLAVKKKMEKLDSKKVLKEIGKKYDDRHWKEIDGYLYKFLYTNDTESTSEEIVLEYNQRGTYERNISFMKKQFAWSMPPFMNMNENAVFMIAAAMTNNIYKAMVMQFRHVFTDLHPTMLLETFLKNFVEAPCRILKKGFNFFEQDTLYRKLLL